MTKQPKEFKVEISPIDDISLNQPNFLKELIGIAETVSSAPTGKPTNLINQFKIYTNGSTYRLYWYDAKNDVWHFVTATS